MTSKFWLVIGPNKDWIVMDFVVIVLNDCFMLCRSDSDSEGENPEKKKLQEHLMGECVTIQ